jgi:two-component system nitrate/nitrite response regulator NarL
MPARNSALIISDHQLFVDLIGPVLSGLSLRVVGRFGFVKPALEFLALRAARLVLLDYMMPVASGPGEDALYDKTGVAISSLVSRTAITVIRQAWPMTRVVVVMEERDPARCWRVIELGAHGVVCKPYGLSEFRYVIRRVLRGDAPVVPRSLAPQLPGKSLAWPQLTPRAVQILSLIQQGQSNRRIARQLGLSETTIRNRFADICIKLGVHTRIEAIARATDLGILDFYY